MYTCIYITNLFISCEDMKTALCMCVHSLSRVWLFATPSMDCSLSVSSVHGILQARILEWVAISYSRGSPGLRDQTHISDISCIGKQILLPPAQPGKPSTMYIYKYMHMYVCLFFHIKSTLCAHQLFHFCLLLCFFLLLNHLFEKPEKFVTVTELG